MFEHAMDRLLQKIYFSDDHARVFAMLLSRELVLHQLRGAANASEWILDFVREPTDQFAAGVELRLQHVVAGNPQVPVERDHFEQQTRFAVDDEWRDRQIDRDRHAAMPQQFQLALDETG